MKEELKQAIEEVAYPMYAKAPNQSEADADYLKDVSFNSMLVAVSTPSILKHADPEIMKQAGWVREEEWISVEDRLPEESEDVLIHYQWLGRKGKMLSVIYTGYYFSGKWHYGEQGEEIIKREITHWKPLPQPPKQ